MHMKNAKWVVGAIAVYFLVACSAGAQARPDARQQGDSEAMIVAKDPSAKLTAREYSNAREVNDFRSPRTHRVSGPRIIMDPSVSPLLFDSTVDLLERFPLGVPLTVEAAEELVNELFYYEDTGDIDLNWQWEEILLATIAAAMDHPRVADDAWYVLDDGLAEFLGTDDAGMEGGAAGEAVRLVEPGMDWFRCWWGYDREPRDGKVNWTWTYICVEE